MRAGAPGLRVLGAVLPNWDVWLDGAGPPPLTYRVTLVLTGHGCLGEYLHRIRQRALPPLRCERGFGAAHVGVLSGVGAAAPRSHHGNRLGPLAAGGPRGTVGEREREEGRDLLL